MKSFKGYLLSEADAGTLAITGTGRARGYYGGEDDPSGESQAKERQAKKLALAKRSATVRTKQQSTISPTTVNAAQIRDKFLGNRERASEKTPTISTARRAARTLCNRERASEKTPTISTARRAARNYAGGNRQGGEFGGATTQPQIAAKTTRGGLESMKTRQVATNRATQNDADRLAQPQARASSTRAAQPQARASSTRAAQPQARASSGMSVSSYAKQRSNITGKNLGGASSVAAGRIAAAKKALSTTGGGAKGNIMRQRAQRDLRGPISGGR